MSIDEKKFKVIEAMLELYNKELAAGKNPKPPVIDDKVFEEFRLWQQKNLAAKVIQ